jgi:histone H3/H4
MSVVPAEKSLALPRASVKRIMKLSDEVQNVSAEAVVAVSKVTEDFLTMLIEKAFDESVRHNRKTVKVRGNALAFFFLYAPHRN